MSEPIATERYRLALIAHHAEKLAELLRGGENYGNETVVWQKTNLYGCGDDHG